MTSDEKFDVLWWLREEQRMYGDLAARLSREGFCESNSEALATRDHFGQTADELEAARKEIHRLGVELATVLLDPRYKAGWIAGHRDSVAELKRLRKTVRELGEYSTFLPGGPDRAAFETEVNAALGE